MLASAGSALAWAPEGSATIHPGVMTFTGGSSFVIHEGLGGVKSWRSGGLVPVR
jgi:hypothetical protein